MHPTITNHHQQMRVVEISSCKWGKGKEQQCMAGLLNNNINFLIILVCLLFIHAKHSPTKLYQCTCTVLLSNHDQSINQFIIIFQQALKILQALTVWLQIFIV